MFARLRKAFRKRFRFGEPTLHIVGDSHVEAFRQADDLNLLRCRCETTIVGGATAVGLRNPNSLTDALRIFRTALLPPRSGVTPAIHLGEVDCGFVIWYRAKAHSKSIDTQVEQSIAAYFAFVDELTRAGYPTVVITGASMPTIRDGENFSQVANLRREVTASLLERTSLTIDYNRLLAVEAEKRGLPFVDIGPALSPMPTVTPTRGITISTHSRRPPFGRTS